MDWREKSIPMSQLHEVLNSILPEYLPISQAPTSSDTMPLNESTKLYKSIDNFGNVFLIQNPAIWILGPNGYIRPKPKKLFTWSEARQQAEAFKGPTTPASEFSKRADRWGDL